ncbi:MAG TPA: M3 family metallopeptidase, partial [Steroidobacteraceae bacterium]|nr:M3 family metallopeptidase [Steroidobacteraceae bacterium]
MQADQLPAFSAFDPQSVEPAIRQLIEASRTKLAAILEAGPVSWDTTVAPVESLQHELARTWSPVGHLNAVANTEALREVYSKCLPLLSAWNTELAQNERLYDAYRTILERDGDQLSGAQRKVLEHALRDFRLAGVSLPAERKARFKACVEELATTQAKFDNNVLDATNAWECHVTDESRLAGLPAAVRDRARNAANEAGRTGWLLALDPPNYQAVMTHADDRGLRREFYEAWTTRASDQGPNAGRWDNGALMEQILALRHEIATLAGFPNYAEYSLATKMARSVPEVLDFLEELARR